jgi:adenine-specific DNA-methyltransferase
VIIGVSASPKELLDQVEKRRMAVTEALEPDQQAKLGQYFTPMPVANFIASQIRLPDEGTLRILDPGAGVGSLAAALIARVVTERPTVHLEVTALEVDHQVIPALERTMTDCETLAAELGSSVTTTVVHEDFIEWAASGEQLGAEGREPFDVVVLNPPYGKLARASTHRALVRQATCEVPNTYAAFLALSTHALAEGGQLAAITPRSFTNGTYFLPFREYLLKCLRFDRIHVYDARNKVFAETKVLQENVIFAATRDSTGQQPDVIVSASESHDGEVRQRTVPWKSIVYPDDPQLFLHINVDERDVELAERLASLPLRLPELQLDVATGRVVDFRAKEHLRSEPVPGSVPLIYPLHMRGGQVKWPVEGARKPNAIVFNDQTRKLTFPAGHYVVVKRMSSKEEPRRVVAAVFDADQVPCDAIGFENHVNVFHAAGRGLPKQLARGLCLWLNSTLLDEFLRRFSGHTQVNATDLRNLRYPNTTQLVAVGRAWDDTTWLGQDKIDALVAEHITGEAPTNA